MLSVTVSVALSVQEVNAKGCYGPVLNFVLKADRSYLRFYSASYKSGDSTHVYLNYKVFNEVPDTGLVVAERKPDGGSYSFAGSDSVSKTEIAVTQSPSETGNWFRLRLRTDCGGTDEQRVIALTGTSDNATNNTTLNWTAYQGWSPGVNRYIIWRNLQGSGFVKYDSVSADKLTYTAHNGGDAFNQAYQIQAIINGDSIASFSNPVQIQFKNEVVVTNVVSADGNDFLNRYFVLDHATLYHDNHLVVYNRWGKEILNKAPYLNDWEALEVPAGTYFYMFTTNSPVSVQKTGWVQVIK